MTELTLRPIATAEEKRAFITEIQQTFQQTFEAEFGKYDKPILPEEDIEESFAAEGAEAYFALAEGQRVGGAIAVPEGAGKGSLHLLYVRPGAQNAGCGHRIWREIERTHPSITLWETHTPYYDKRNIHFYVNRCGFHIVEFFCPRHPDPHQAGETAGNIPVENNLFFRFEKEMR